ncbi:DUF5908 family protein [uncultured Aquimarina sp.]|uniref:DUF5908 family protein n=1 Tax=uncultured Aquimarina sp. TaxID=575652 RepID=UPI002637FA0A|nr:DUF5908 family protein [uncultured Aquimarina sp.]
MPVEIKELIIRTTIDNQNEPERNSSSSEDCATPSPSESNQIQLDEVLRMMKNKNER